MSTDLEVVELAPAPEQLRYTFGGGEPLITVRPGTVVELATEDCFGGRVTSADDLPSRVCQFPHLNPVTGPIAVEGAEPGDTLAVHLVEIAPARDWAVSATFPHFGALTATPPHGDAARAARGGRVGLRGGPGGGHLPVPPPHGRAGGRAAAGPDARDDRRRAGRRRKAYLGTDAVVADGMHDRLRQTAAAYLAQR